MSRKKAKSQRAPEKDQDRPRRRRRELLFWLAVVLAIALIVLLVPWQAVGSWIADTAGYIWDTLGWGLALIALVVTTLAGLTKRRRLLLLVRRWNRWLGAVSVLLAGWAALGVFGLGGTVGATIIGPSPIGGYGRIAGLCFLGLVLIKPDIGYYAVIAVIKPIAALRAWRRRRALSRPSRPPAQKPAPAPTVRGTPAIRPSAVTQASQPPKPGLRQVAQEVWKKYGEPAKLTVDGWRLPPVDILDKASSDTEFSKGDNLQRAAMIEQALASYGVEGKVVQINAGPTVTQFGVEPGWDRRTKEVREKDRDGNVHVKVKEVSKTRVKVDRITSLANDLALALAAPSIRIEAPVPGKSVVGIEVPNVVSTAVNLRGVIETNSFQKILSRSKLALALGKGAGGEAESADLAKMPHLLIAGATGSGKTVCLNSIICCLLLHNTPNDVRLIMIDPKRVELAPYNSIPHLAIPVIVDTERALDALRWLNREMDKRYQQLAKGGARNIDGYNKNKQGKEKLPRLVLIIDELADLMMAGFDEVEHILCRLAQLSRAVGIHLIVATQRPSVDVVTGLIKANFPTRISFAVTSQVDSRTILDGAGAEKLLGRGDMLFMPTEAAKPKRLQGTFVSDAEIERLVYFWGSQRSEEMPPVKIEEELQTVAKVRGAPRDELLEAAKQLAREHASISTSFLQRRLQIGYPRAARLKEQLDEELAAEAEALDSQSNDKTSS